MACANWSDSFAGQPFGTVEFAQMTAEGVSIHAARLGRPKGLAGQLGADVVRQTNDDLPRAAKSLNELRLNVVVFARTA